MSELINNNVFDSNKKFVDLSSLDYFWDKAKSYIDGVDEGLTGRVKTNEDAIKAINEELESLSGGAGSIQTQISNAISALDLPNTYEAKGDAAKAEAAAKAYADGLAANYDAAGAAEAAKSYADGLDAAMDTRVKVLEAIDHAKLAEDASAAAVATILDDAPEAFDTLKEVAAWIADSETAAEAADLVTRVAALEAIDHDAYVDADEKVLEDANAYADSLASNYDAAGSAEAAKNAAIADAAGKYQVAGNYEAEGAAAQALVDAKAYVDGKVDGKFDASGSAAAAQAAAIAQAKADAAEALKAYYSKTEVDNLLASNTAADKAYAKQYTDELFNSFQFAQNSDIDALFA
jgi:hypothetical protein